MGQVNLQMIQSGSPLWEWISEMQRDEMTSEMTCLSGKSAVPLLARRVSRPDVSASPKMPAPMRRSGAASALWVASALLAVLLPTRTADAAALSAAVHGYATVNSTVEFGPGNTYWCAGTPAHPPWCCGPAPFSAGLVGVCADRPHRSPALPGGTRSPGRAPPRTRWRRRLALCRQLAPATGSTPPPGSPPGRSRRSTRGASRPTRPTAAGACRSPKGSVHL